MKIDETLSLKALQESNQPSANKSAGGDQAFALMLQGEISDQPQQIAQGDAVSLPGSIPAIPGTQSMAPGSTQTPDASEAISALDGVLSQLDALKDALQKTGSPKDINSLIEGINSQTAGLDDKMSGLPADHKLKDIAEELKVTAYMESLKWKRGDYL